MKLRRIIFLILIIINCITIFYYSNQVANISDNSSGRVVAFLVKIIPSLKNMNIIERERICSEVLQPIVRKLAHFTLYTILGFFIMNFVYTFNGTKYQKGLTTWTFGTFYAVTDEIHQLFIEGRSCELRDVCIDSLGVITGVFIALLVLCIIIKFFNKDKKQKNIEKNKNEIKKFNKKTKILFISSTGGHFSELMQLRPIMKKCNYRIITEKTDTNKSLKRKFRTKIDFLLYETKKHPFKYFFVLIANSFLSFYYYLKFRPQIIITTGTHTAGPMCCIGKILGSKIIYIETFANRYTKTATGKILYYIADEFIVQWEEMLKIYPRATYLGWIY